MLTALSQIFILYCLMNSIVADVCESLCRCNMTEKLVNCSKTGITDLQSKFVLGNVTEFTTVDLCYNEISTFSSEEFGQSTQIKHLSLCNCAIDSINNNKLYNLDLLQTLYLNRNKLTFVASGTFEYTPLLIHLDLAHNSIAFIGSGTFSRLGQLQTLRLSYNKIAIISSDVFVGLNSLQTLELNNNYISNLATAFSSLGSLETLRLGHNFVRSIGSQTFSLQAKLKLLDLSYNALENINEDVFCTVTRLVLSQLYINVNQLTSVSFVKCLPALTIFDLSNNLLTVVNASTFAGLENLLELHMESMSRLTALHRYAFASLHSINRLYVKECQKLEVVEAPLFAAEQNLTEIDFSRNRLKALPEDVFGNATVQHVDFSNNPWSCWCDITWMVRSPPSSLLHLDVVCSAPEHLAGMLLSDAASQLALHCAAKNNANSGINVGLIAAVCSSLAAVLIAGIVLFMLLWLCRPAPREYPTKKRRGVRHLSRAQQQRLDRVNRDWMQVVSPTDTETTEVDIEEDEQEHLGASADDNDNKLVLDNSSKVKDVVDSADINYDSNSRVVGKRVRFA